MYVLEHIFRHYDTQTCIINKYVIHLQPKIQQNNNPINKERFLKRLFQIWKDAYLKLLTFRLLNAHHF